MIQLQKLESPSKVTLIIHRYLVQEISQGIAYKLQIQKGDVKLRIQHNVIRVKTGFDNVVKKLPKGQSVAVLIQRSGSSIFLALKVEK